MLAHAPRPRPASPGRLVALPVADAPLDVVLMINMFLFPAEVDRVLPPGGHVVWVNTLGDQTPIHLPQRTSHRTAG